MDAFAAEPLPPNSVVEKNIADVEAVGEAIRRVAKRSGSRTKNVCVAVAGSSVITKVITMPASLSEEEMESQIELEADQYIPYSLEEVNLDFEILGTSDDNPDTVDVLNATHATWTHPCNGRERYSDSFHDRYNLALERATGMVGAIADAWNDTSQSVEDRRRRIEDAVGTIVDDSHNNRIFEPEYFTYLLAVKN